MLKNEPDCHRHHQRPDWFDLLWMRPTSSLSLWPLWKNSSQHSEQPNSKQIREKKSSLILGSVWIIFSRKNTVHTWTLVKSLDLRTWGCETIDWACEKMKMEAEWRRRRRGRRKETAFTIFSRAERYLIFWASLLWNIW